MIIEIPGCKWRIRGGEGQWSLESPYTDNKTGETAWRGRYFYASLPYAVDKAHELMLQESADAVRFADAPGECRKAKESLLRAVRRALADREGRGAA